MLIGVPALLSPELLFTLRAMGHGDEIAFVDANYPAAEHARRLVRADGLPLVDLLHAVLTVLPLDSVPGGAIFRAAEGNTPPARGKVHEAVDALCARMAPGLSVVALDGEALYPRIRAAHAIVATGERAFYGNVILRKGVVRP